MDSPYGAVTCDVAAHAGTDPVAMALSTDIAQCSAELENAYFATDSGAAIAALDRAATWMRRAQNNAGAQGDENVASRAACIATNITAALAACQQAATPAALAAVQDNQVRPLQGQLVGLGGVVLGHDSAGAGFTLLGIALPVVAVYSVLVAEAVKSRRGAAR